MDTLKPIAAQSISRQENEKIDVFQRVFRQEPSVYVQLKMYGESRISSKTRSPMIGGAVRWL